MPELLLFAVLVAGIVVLSPVAERLRIPQPVLLTVFGLVVPLFPHVPELRVDPDLILPVVLPPLLFAATQRASAREFRDNAKPILVLAVGLTVVSAVVAAVVAHAFGMPWGPAAVLGAIVSPPDPVAATAVARRLRLPGRLVAVLEGEGMFNDATALVMYKVAVGAVVAGHATTGAIGVSFVLGVVVGVGVGLVAGWLTRLALARLDDAAPQTTVTIAVPFAAYVGADHLGGSGVLAVLVLGLYLRTRGHRSYTSGGWLLGRAVWNYLDWIVTGLVFVLIGFELTAVLEDDVLDRSTVAVAAAVVAALVVVRFVWVFPASYLASRGARLPQAVPGSPREALVVSWAGMRGVVTVASALALPLTVDADAGGGAFPWRTEVLVVGLATVLVTLVVQGLTLAPLVTRLGVGTEGDIAAEAADLRRAATAQALDVVRTDVDRRTPPRVRDAVVLQYEGYLAAQDALLEARRGRADDDHDDGDEDALEGLLERASEAERDFVVDARARGEVSAEAADEVLDDVESRARREQH
ncbi:Na+/H+ antiporter [Luteimicrobium subarcticum]|uniref:Sodium/proton antiporter (CPA1 family) n=1 Tax=Luteimicrobium subarcticum TaxID=620910 RepID=A0A2M8W787_9MICO|nr:Na+/H+ antiporter [Luteimicrobium subarcticum]PJI86754.1 sodium/proton antiporter (CPA1 family) [Luteimicrobium subarcticum]